MRSLKEEGWYERYMLNKMFLNLFIEKFGPNGVDKNIIIAYLRNHRDYRNGYIETYQTNKYVYLHLGTHVFRAKRKAIEHLIVTRGRPSPCINSNVNKDFREYYFKFPYYIAVIITYYQDALNSTFFSVEVPGVPLFNSFTLRNQENQDDSSPQQNQISMIQKEHIVGAVTKNPVNVIVTGANKKDQRNIVGLPVLDDKGNVKIFCKRSPFLGLRKNGKKSKDSKPKWYIFSYEDLLINDLDNLSRSRVTESSSVKLINSSSNCFNLEFKVNSLKDELTNEVLTGIKAKILEEKSICKLKGILVQRNEKEGQTLFLTEYAGLPISFLSTNCELFKPSLKGFNIPKNRNKVEGITCKIVRNKQTIFNMDERVKILKFEKNSKTPQRHYFTVQSLETPSKISTVYSHNLKVI